MNLEKKEGKIRKSKYEKRSVPSFLILTYDILEVNKEEEFYVL